MITLRSSSWAYPGILATVMVLALTNLAACARKRAVKDEVGLGGNPVPVVQAQGERTFDFGSVLDGDLVRHTFGFVNKSGRIVDLTLKYTCSSGLSKLNATKLQPEERGTLEAIVKTDGQRGNIHEIIDLLETGSDTVLESFFVVGEVKPSAAISISPSSLESGNVRLGERKTYNFKVLVTSATEGDVWTVRVKTLRDAGSEVMATIGELRSDPEAWRMSFGHRRMADGVVSVTFDRVGLIDAPLLHLAVHDGGGIERAAVVVFVRAKVMAEFACQPSRLCLGMLGGMEQCQTEIELESAVPMNTQPNVSSNNPLLDVNVITHAGKWKVQVKSNSSKWPLGQQKAIITVNWGSTVVHVPAFGVRY